jgi:hypothetical protein
MLNTVEVTPPFNGLAGALEKLLRPSVGFQHPWDVLKDPWLDVDEKRAILSSWASDGCAVENQPTLRWLIGTEAPVALHEVLAALSRLDALEQRREWRAQ